MHVHSQLTRVKRSVWSGLRFPLPLTQLLLNVTLTATYAYQILLSPEASALRAARREVGLRHAPLDSLPFHLIPSILELEYSHLPPPNAVLAGPILVPMAPLSADDHPGLAAFLDRGRTVYLNMGSLFLYTPADVLATCASITSAHARLADHGSLQVLWKLPKKDEFTDVLTTGLKDVPMESVRVEEWIAPDALEVLEHRNVVVSVHHGGASKSCGVCSIFAWKRY
jgi:hypothetical protein